MELQYKIDFFKYMEINIFFNPVSKRFGETLLVFFRIFICYIVRTNLEYAAWVYSLHQSVHYVRLEWLKYNFISYAVRAVKSGVDVAGL
jgi:hypothetical protein